MSDIGFYDHFFFFFDFFFSLPAVPLDKCGNFLLCVSFIWLNWCVVVFPREITWNNLLVSLLKCYIILSIGNLSFWRVIRYNSLTFREMLLVRTSTNQLWNRSNVPSPDRNYYIITANTILLENWWPPLYSRLAYRQSLVLHSQQMNYTDDRIS